MNSTVEACVFCDWPTKTMENRTVTRVNLGNDKSVSDEKVSERSHFNIFSHYLYRMGIGKSCICLNSYVYLCIVSLEVFGVQTWPQSAYEVKREKYRKKVNIGWQRFLYFVFVFFSISISIHPYGSSSCNFWFCFIVSLSLYCFFMLEFCHLCPSICGVYTRQQPLRHYGIDRFSNEPSSTKMVEHRNEFTISILFYFYPLLFGCLHSLDVCRTISSSTHDTENTTSVLGWFLFSYQ